LDSQIVIPKTNGPTGRSYRAFIKPDVIFSLSLFLMKQAQSI